MVQNLSLNKQDIHLWRASLIVPTDQEHRLGLLLSPDEKKRAERFRFGVHRRRFIVARGTLRRILACYLDIKPQDIQFLYHEHGKPYLAQCNLQFNLSHSQEMAVYALTQDNPVGVDIEFVRTTYRDAVPKRFFSEMEYSQLIALPEADRINAFYHIWARKEALIKAIGEGLRFPLSSFSVSLTDLTEELLLDFNGMSSWHLQSFIAHPAYQSAFATKATIEKVMGWEWMESEPVRWQI